MPLEPKDQRHLIAAEGYMGLEMYLDANAELEEITPEVRHLPEVLAVKTRLYQHTEKWELMQVVAKKLTQYDTNNPQHWIDWAYATRRAVSLEAAKNILLKALTLNTEVAVFHFNLACYECQLRNLELAKDYLKTTFDIEPRYREIALDDEDLKPLWNTLKAEM